jgi:curved DNA-binding protein CbpA
MSTFVPPKIAIEGAELISSGLKNSLPGDVVKGVELMLLNSCIDNSALKGQSDVSVLLRQGLDYLSKSPYEALGVPVGSKTVQIRKAFKKSALKYHPDKNPKTTPLFQVMNAACDRLCDPLLREKEEKAAFAKQPQKPSQPSSAAAGRPTQPTQAPTAPTGHGSGAGAFPFQSSDPSMKPAQAPPSMKPAQVPPSSYSGTKPPAQDTTAPPFQFPPFARPRYDPRTNKWNVDTDWTKYAQPPVGADANSNPGGNNMQYRHQAEQVNRAQEATKQRRQYYEEVLKEQYSSSKADLERKEKDDAAAKQRAKQLQEDSMNEKYGAKSNKSNAGKVDDKPSQAHYFGGNGPGSGLGPKSGAKQGPTLSQSNSYSSSPNPTPPSGSSSNEPPSPKSSSFFNAGLGSRSGSFKGMGGMKPAPVPAPSPAKVPRPYGLRCLFLGTNAAELEWVVSKYHRHSLLAELSWRNKALGAKAWESSSKLISSGKCRKKNLAAGAEYEFRVRAVEDLPGGLVGLRSDWSDSISIVLMADKTTDSSVSTASSNSTTMGGEKQLKRQNSYFGNKSNLPNVAEEEDSKDNTTLPNLNPSQPISMKAAVKPAIEKAAMTNTNTNTMKLRRKSSFVSSTNSLGSGLRVSEEEELLSSVDSSSSSSFTSDAKKFHRFDRFRPPSCKGAAADDKRPDSQSGARCQRAGLETTDTSTLHEMTKKEQDGPSKVGRRVKPSPANDKIAWNLKVDCRYSDGKASNLLDMKDDGFEEEQEEIIDEEEQEEVVGGQPLREQPLRTFTKQPTHTHVQGLSAATGAAPAKMSTPLSAARKDRDSSNIAQSTDLAGSKQQSKSKVDDDDHRQQQQQPMSAAAAARAHDDVEEAEHSNRTDVEEEEDEYLDDQTFEEEEEEEEERVFVLNEPRMLPARARGKKQHSTDKSDGLPPPYMHPVRAEPYTKSAVVGYLLGGGREVLSNAECGSWLKVRIHVSSSSSSPRSRKSIGTAVHHPTTDLAAVWGWAVRADAQNNYLTLQQQKRTGSSSSVRVDPTSTYTLPPIVPSAKHKVVDAAVDRMCDRTPQKSDGLSDTITPPPLDDSHSSSHRPLADLSMQSTPLLSPTCPGKPRPCDGGGDGDDHGQVQEWSELFDSSGHVYYYNASTFQSQWEPPDWVEECDTATGHK